MTIIETNLKFKSNHAIRSGKPEGIVLHHAAASSASVETIHEWHLDNGWAGIGYHFYVRKDGKVYRGRPEDWVGSHTSGHNEMLGICAEGNFQTETMGAAQHNAISELIVYLCEKYGAMKVYGHRDLGTTSCPGRNYPFESIVNGAKKEEKVSVYEWQKAAIADGYSFPKYGADGMWGSECESVAKKALVKRRIFYTNKNLTKIVQRVVGVTVDGLCGKDTEAAIKAWQKKNGLSADGVVGINSWKKMLGV